MVAQARSCYSSAAATCSTRRRPAPAAVDLGRAPSSLPTLSSRNKETIIGGRKARATACRRFAEAELIIRRKVEALNRLVRSGRGTARNDVEDDSAVDELLLRAADYIVRLKVQVKAMQLMVDVLEHTKDSCN